MEGSNINSNFEVKPSKTELPIPLVNGIHLHSIYNPVREAEGFISQNENILSRSRYILLFGLGFGYHLNQLEFRLRILYGEDYSIYVIEPNQDVYQECLERGLYNPNSRVRIFCKKSVDDYFKDEDLVSFMSKKPTVIPHPASFNLYESFFKAFMSYKAPTDIESIALFIEDIDLKNHLRKNYGANLVDEVFDIISKGKYPLKPWDHLLSAFKEIGAKNNSGV